MTLSAKNIARLQERALYLNGNNPPFGPGLRTYTVQFIEHLKSSPDGIVTLTKAAADLKIPIRRIYDINTVTTILGITEKIGKRCRLTAIAKSTLANDYDNPDPELKLFRSRLKKLRSERHALEKKVEDLNRKLSETFAKAQEQDGDLCITREELLSLFPNRGVIVLKPPKNGKIVISRPRALYDAYDLDDRINVEIRTESENGESVYKPVTASITVD